MQRGVGMEQSNGERIGDKPRRNIFALGFVSFFTDVSSEMVFSLLPTFILGLPGSSRVMLGLIEGAAEALSYGMRAISGIFSDKFKKRKAVVLIGYGLSNVVKPLFSVAQTAMDALVIRVADRIGKGIRTAPRDALLSESASEKQRGAAFGLHRTLDQSGAILGPVIASTLMFFLGFTAKDVFLLSFIPGVTAILLLVFLVEERVAKGTGKFELLEGFRDVLKYNFSRLLIIVALFSLGAFNFSFILLNAKESGIIDELLPLLYAVINISHTLVAIPSGLLADRIGREKVLMIGYGIFLVTVLLILLGSANYYLAFVIAIVFGLYDGIANTVTRALIPTYAAGALRGTAYGIYYLVVGLSFFVANTIVGTLWQYFGSSTAVIYSISLSTVAIIGMAFFINRQD